MLTEKEVRYFRTWGFLVLRDLLAPDEVDRLRIEFNDAMAAAYIGNEFDGTKRHWIPMMGPAAPTFGKLAGDPRFFENAHQLSGVDLVLYAVDANRYVGDTNWHPDGGGAHSVKFTIYLDRVGAESGALRVIPLSHRATPRLAEPGLAPEFKEMVVTAVEEANAVADIRSLPAVSLESAPGDVVVFDPHIFHASVGGSNDRPMCTVAWVPYPATGEAPMTQVTQRSSNVEYIKSFSGATDLGGVFDLPWFAAQDWGDGHRQVIENLRRCGAL
jgi:Phytanoyl-CoA dioxygenase (PhyH)